MRTASEASARGTRVWLAAEYTLVFFGLVGAYAIADVPGGPIPVLVLLAVVAVWYLRRQPTFDNRNLWRGSALRRPVLRPVLIVWTLAAVAFTAFVVLTARADLFGLPREEPLLWLAITIGYPLLSVYPQELVFRAFLMHRYAPVFTDPRAAAGASAAAFGFAHIIFDNWFAVVLTLVGGWLFARRYQRTDSLAVVSIEHAAYGLLIFTIGLGEYFYHGAA